MAHFELSQIIKSEKELSASGIADFVKQRLGDACKYRVLSQTGNSIEVRGRVRERFFTPVVRFTARLTTEVVGDKAKVLVSVDTRPNWIVIMIILFALLCICTIILILPGVMFIIVAIVLWVTQAAKPKRMFEDILRVASTEFSF